MAGDTPTRIFISYSRADSQFVDRLEADLRSRRFDPWVDRRKLEGGQDWQDELQRAIDRCEVVCLVLTSTALGSDAVKMEYRYAQRIHKPLIPLMLQECELPMELGTMQWVDFQRSYDEGLKNTVAALSRLDHNGAADSAPAAAPQVVNLRDLYARGLEAERQGNLEQAATFYGQIHDKEPGYLNGIVASKLTTLNERLFPERSRRLWEDAKLYRRAGEYSREVGALQALIGLGPKDEAAEERLPIATQNRDNADLYDVVRELVSLGDLDAAREQLTLLWQNAPYYEDPAGVARQLSMKVSTTYDHMIDAKAAEAKCQRALADANAWYKQKVVEENTGWNAQCSEMRARLTSGDPSALLGQMQLVSPRHGGRRDTYTRFERLQNKYQRLEQRRRRLDSLVGRLETKRPALAAAYLVVLAVIVIVKFKGHGTTVAIATVALVVLIAASGLFLCAVFYAKLQLGGANQRVQWSQEDIAKLQPQLDSERQVAFKQWFGVSEPQYQQRLQQHSKSTTGRWK